MRGQLVQQVLQNSPHLVSLRTCQLGFSHPPHPRPPHSPLRRPALNRQVRPELRREGRALGRAVQAPTHARQDRSPHSPYFHPHLPQSLTIPLRSRRSMMNRVRICHGALSPAPVVPDNPPLISPSSPPHATARLVAWRHWPWSCLCDPPPDRDGWTFCRSRCCKPRTRSSADRSYPQIPP